MLEFLCWLLQGFPIFWGVALCIAGIKAALLHDGPGLFELIAMLWRGEIKTRKAR